MATISRRLAGPSYLPHLRREDGDDERGGLPYPFSGSASTGGDPQPFLGHPVQYSTNLAFRGGDNASLRSHV